MNLHRHLDVELLAIAAGRGDLAGDAQLEEALAFRIPSGNAAGLSLDELADDGAEAWIRWALNRSPGSWPRPFERALRLVAREQFPHVWDAGLSESSVDEGREAA